MTIQLPTGQNWSVQLVCIGSRVLLEVSHNQLKCSAWLEPLESPTQVAYRLIDKPACAL